MFENRLTPIAMTLASTILFVFIIGLWAIPLPPTVITSGLFSDNETAVEPGPFTVSNVHGWFRRGRYVVLEMKSPARHHVVFRLADGCEDGHANVFTGQYVGLSEEPLPHWNPSKPYRLIEGAKPDRLLPKK